MKSLLFGAIAAALLCTPAFAQQQQRGNANNNNAFGRGDAVFQLPARVQSIVSIDALNTIIIASEGERRGETEYTPTIIKHVYSGGIAQLFGGISVPTAQFATPGQFGNNNNGGAQNGFGGNNNGGGFGGNNNGGGFGTQNNGGFNNGGFGGGTFQNGVLGGNGFNTLNRNTVVNARIWAR